MTDTFYLLGADQQLCHFPGDLNVKTNPYDGLDEVLITAGFARESLHQLRVRLLEGWSPGLAIAFEELLRALVVLATPSEEDYNYRLDIISRYQRLVESGVGFACGFDLLPFGSFVSGLFTKHGDLDLSIEGTAWSHNSERISVLEMDRHEQERYAT